VVAGVVLAAGASTRMGQNKLLLRVEGETLLRRAVTRALAAALAPVLVVVGHERERAEKEIEGLAVRAVYNPDHAAGQHTSFRAGIAAVPEDAGAAVVLLADMPRVTSEMIGALVVRWRETKAPLVISDYGGVHAPPTLYDRSLFAEILAQPGEGCGKAIVRRHRGEAAAVAWPAEALADVDVPADLAHAI
jgi:molybdenum cofactor cytidylyltransferase